ncbi:M3 family metallopeptidase [Streptomyces sp. YIM 98790]|uniref:M3 family metallopeptidase n=1 Tax=Streptomyces sp. YIM 98790 TaxID=2689077 RepID=UPI00140E2305|nr:M3 family metallopeptidase [Streptomyces sp. YIM 98790]
MAANISLTYSEIETVCNTLDSSVEDTLVPRMKEAKAEVDELLENALVLVQSSPALQQQYEKFTTALTEATDSIKQYANQFRQIKKSVEDMDQEIANKVNSSS